jgi:uncharacterized repeat protein (TIGR02543 family)
MKKIIKLLIMIFVFVIGVNNIEAITVSKSDAGFNNPGTSTIKVNVNNIKLNSTYATISGTNWDFGNMVYDWQGTGYQGEYLIYTVDTDRGASKGTIAGTYNFPDVTVKFTNNAAVSADGTMLDVWVTISNINVTIGRNAAGRGDSDKNVVGQKTAILKSSSDGLSLKCAKVKTTKGWTFGLSGANVKVEFKRHSTSTAYSGSFIAEFRDIDSRDILTEALTSSSQGIVYNTSNFSTNPYKEAIKPETNFINAYILSSSPLYTNSAGWVWHKGLENPGQTNDDFNTAIRGKVTGSYYTFSFSQSGTAGMRFLSSDMTSFTYKVTFNPAGGSITPEAQYVVSGGKATDPGTPGTNSNPYGACTFNGWNFDFNTAITSDKTVTARWICPSAPQIPTYTVNWYVDGALYKTQTVNSGTSVSDPMSGTLNPVGSCTMFDGWYSNNSYTTKVTLPTTITANTNFYARNKNVCPKVTFESNGGTPVESQTIVPSSGKTKADEPTPPTKEGFNFAGWYEESSLVTIYNFSKEVTSDITLYAKWTNNYTVTFKVDGIPVTAKEVASGGKASEPIQFEDDGSCTELNGWYTNEDYTGSRFNFNTPITDNITLYAKTENVCPIVRFESNGGTEVEPQTINPTTGAYRATKPINPTKAGYRFDDWYTEPEFKTIYDFNSVVTKDITLYAKWVDASEPIKGKIVVKYIDEDSFESIMDDEQFTDEIGKSLSIQPKSKDGYTVVTDVSKLNVKYTEETQFVTIKYKKKSASSVVPPNPSTGIVDYMIIAFIIMAGAFVLYKFIIKRSYSNRV